MSVAIAGFTASASLVFYFWPKKENYFPFSLVLYISIATMTAALIMSTGKLNSSYVTLWILVSAFAGVFLFWGAIPIFIADFVFLSIQYLEQSLNLNSTVAVVFGSILPLVVGLIMWRNKQSSNQNTYLKTKSTTNEINELASNSEVVINAIGDGIMAIDSHGIIQFINPAAQEILGWSAQDSIKLSYKSVLQLFDQEGNILDASSDPIQQVLNTNQQLRTNTLTLTTKTGKKIIISLVVSPVGAMGSGIIAVFHDITAEKAEEREQAEFISTASHEMRTPVASIEGYLGLALNPQTAQIDARARDFIQKAHESAKHLGRLFQDLLDVSKADDGRVSNNPAVINMVTFIKDIVQGLAPHAEAKNIRLIYKPMPNDNALDKTIAPVFIVNLDADHVREVISNLIENAIKYTPQGEVAIDISGDEDHVIISVKDTGIGIPAEDIPHLFQKFYRVDNINTRDIGGTGLGLYLSRRLVELMGGRIWVESAYNSGSTFFVELPRINSQTASNLSIETIESRSAMTFGQNKTDPQAASQPDNPWGAPNPTQKPTTEQPKPHTVPRVQSLTSDQIADYVAKQRALATEQQALVSKLEHEKPTNSNTLPQPAIKKADQTDNTSANRALSIKIPSRDA